MVIIADYEWPTAYCMTTLTGVNHMMYCNSTAKEPLIHSMLGESHLLDGGMYPPLTQSLGPISVKPVIVFGLITDAQSATLSLGVGQRSLCAHSGRCGHLRSESAKLSCMCLCARKIGLPLTLCGMER